MLEWWPVLVFGWPAVIASVLCSTLGLVRKAPRLVVGGALLALPFFLYLTMTPMFAYMGPFLPLAHFGSAYALARRRQWLAWILLAPVFLLVTSLGYAVIDQWM
ncbi:MAG: hypothetical protein ACE5JX_12320 [Acidobacteriota bacterium]